MISNHEGGAKGTYWYFRFTDHFFDDLEILRMENLPANAGYEYIVILLKLYCLSTRSGGFVKIRTSFGGQIDYTLLSDALRHKSRETVYAAVSYFISVGLIQIMEAVDFTTFFAPGVKNNIGKSSKDADKRREQRLDQDKKAETHALPDPKVNTVTLGKFANVILNENELQAFRHEFANASKLIEKLSVYKQANPDKQVDDYAVLCRWAETKGIRKEEENPAATKSAADIAVPTGVFNNVSLSPAEWDKICRKFADPHGLVDYISQRLHEEGYKMPSHYAFAIKVGKEDHWMTLAEKIKQESKRKENQEKFDAQVAADEAEYDEKAAGALERMKEELGLTSDADAAQVVMGKMTELFGSAKK